MQPDFDILRARSDAAAAMVISSCKRISLMLRAYNPNQLRDEIGRWTYGGGGYQAQRKPVEGIQVVQRVPPRGIFSGIRRINGVNVPISPSQQIRLNAAIARADAAIARVRENVRDQNWRPRPGLYEGVEGEISHQEGRAQEAEARLRERQFDNYLRTGERPNSAENELLPRARTPDPIKNQAKLESQMQSRGWTYEQIEQAIRTGERFPTKNFQTGGDATRYIHPKTGRSVTIDNQTNGIIQVGKDGHKY